MNIVVIDGRLGRDFDLKFLPSGDAVASASLAHSQRWQKDGEWQEKTHWVNLSAFGKSAEGYAQRYAKGDLILVTGELQERTWEKDGQKQSRIEIKVSRIQKMGGNASPSERGDRTAQPQSRSESTGGGGDVYPPFNPYDDDNIPFKCHPDFLR